MTEINSSQDVLADYRYQPKTREGASNELGKNEFMELMIAQLENQSPLDPQDNGEFIAQLAEFSALEEMQNLNKTVNNFATQFQSTQALQASAMVGRSVLVPAGEGPLAPNGSMSGVVEVPSSTSSLTISIFNRSGELVNRYDMGQQMAGSVPFIWDGTNQNGDAMPYDEYTIKAEARVGGAAQQLSTLLSANVNSVSIAQGGAISLNLNGMGSVPLENVREIN
ncbi:MAG: flagellar hook assembly protein FlgD [Oleiphilaceae bacterium]|nr:flagellar hook assembly protein FlgD [Oleiphilaceae bacterium]